MKNSTKEIHFRALGFKINDSSLIQAVNEVKQLIENRNRGYVSFCEANMLSTLLFDKKLRRILREASLVYPDGISLTMLCYLSGHGKIRRVPGPSFMLKAIDYGQQFGWRHYLYGSSERVINNLTNSLKQFYPKAVICGSYAPPFRENTGKEEKEILDNIREAKPDLLWVALGGGKQEYWMYEHLEQLNVPVMLGVGAAFDFHANEKKWAPEFIRKLGMEWLYRMFTGGRSTFFRNLKCVSIVGIIILHSLLMRFVRLFAFKVR